MVDSCFTDLSVQMLCFKHARRVGDRLSRQTGRHRRGAVPIGMCRGPHLVSCRLDARRRLQPSPSRIHRQPYPRHAVLDWSCLLGYKYGVASRAADFRLGDVALRRLVRFAVILSLLGCAVVVMPQLLGAPSAGVHATTCPLLRVDVAAKVLGGRAIETETNVRPPSGGVPADTWCFFKVKRGSLVVSDVHAHGFCLPSPAAAISLWRRKVAEFSKGNGSNPDFGHYRGIGDRAAAMTVSLSYLVFIQRGRAVVIFDAHDSSPSAPSYYVRDSFMGMSRAAAKAGLSARFCR